MIGLSKFESDLIKLNWVWLRLWAMYTEFPKIQGNDPNSKTFRSVIREMIILQLDNFLKIRDELLKEPSFKKLDNCLSLLWQPIVTVKTPIKKIRNNYVAHVQEDKFVKKPFQVMIQEIIDKYQLPTSWGYWVMLAGCVMFYGGMIDANFKKEWNTAEKKYKAMSPVSTKYGNVGMSNYKRHLKPILEKTKKTLLANGYKVTR